MHTKKTILWTVIAVGLVGVLLLVSNATSKDFKDKKASKTSASSFVVATACELFDINDAKQVLGETAEQPEELPGANASSDDIDVTQCLYQTSVELGDIAKQKHASLLARSAKTESGADSNNQVFNGPAKPDNVQDVEGYGDASFWNSEFGQLNILKDNNWYILQTGGSVPTERTLEETKKFADVIISRL